MGFPVKLREIIEAIDFQTDESTAYVNKETGEIVIISEEEFHAAGDQESLENYPEWQQDNIKIAREILDNEANFLHLPNSYDIHEYQIIEEFCLSIEDRGISEQLYKAIKGKGAFRKFKESIQRFEVADEWYKYRDEAIKRIAIDWCKSNHIEFEEE
jgi:PHD/YefM family antitoxin component YafN of YafNO toxin-antitoxin module